MEKSEQKRAERRLNSTKMGLLQEFPFYALLLTHANFVADKNCKSITCYNNEIIYLPEYVLKLDDEEIKFVLMHLIMHLALGHPFRKQENYDIELYDLACDIVVNSNIINNLSGGHNLYCIYSNCEYLVFKKKFSHLGEIPYLTPDKKDGFYFTAEEVYKMLQAEKTEFKDKIKLFSDCCYKEEKEDCFDITDEFDNEKDNKKENKNKSKSKNETKKQNDGNKGEENNNKNDEGKSKGKGKNNTDFDPDDDRELQELLNSIKEQTEQRREKYENRQNDNEQKNDEFDDDAEPFDDHSYWQGEDEEALIPPSEAWNQRCFDLANIIDSGCLGRSGSFPAGIKRKLNEIMNPILDWRVVLNDFIQEEVCDYSFSPPDKRLQDCPFFLPDFNDTEMVVKKILFAIDCSGSMSNSEVTQCYSEIYHAILQFNGKLEGYVGYFDSAFTPPVPFKDIEEFSASLPTGGGGTEIKPVFEYVNNEMKDDPPVSIIVLTDGGITDIPSDDSVTKGIPVLWVINNNEETPPPWGKVIRMIGDNCRESN